MDQAKLGLLKKALRNLSSAIDVLSEREREQLKDLILKGQVATEEELRGYLSRLIAARARQREKEKQKQAERVAAARARQKEEEEGGEKTELQASLEADNDAGSFDLESDAPAPGAGQGGEGEPAKITGKVIDAKSRKPVPYVRVRVIGTSFNEETETTGVFIWEEMPRGRQITFELTRKEYKNVNLQYRSTLDNEQHIVIKLVPQEVKGEKKSGGGKPGGH